MLLLPTRITNRSRCTVYIDIIYFFRIHFRIFQCIHHHQFRSQTFRMAMPTTQEGGESFVFGDLVIDTASHSVKIAGEEAPLTPKRCV